MNKKSEIETMSLMQTLLNVPVITKVNVINGILTFSDIESRLATEDDYNLADRYQGSVFEALKPGDIIELSQGMFKLDDNLNLLKIDLEIEMKSKFILDLR